MIKLLESIKIKNYKALNLEYHNKRLNYSRKELFNCQDEIDLADYIPKAPDNSIYKLRVIYSKEIEKVELNSYQIKVPKSFRFVEFNREYKFKYLNREEIEKLKRKNSDVDEIILIKKGKITDTTIANIALFIENSWVTPKEPLLRGTTRERFLRSGLLKEQDLYPQDLKRAKKIALLNAMVEFLEIDNYSIKGLKDEK